MALCQIYSDTRPGPEDLGFNILFPAAFHLSWRTETFFATMADIWLVGSYVLFYGLIVPFLSIDKKRLATRYTWCLCFIFFMRCLTLLATRYPQIPGGLNGLYNPDVNAFVGALLIVVGARATQTDYMFSGHTANWILLSMFFWHYRKAGGGYSLMSVLFWAYNLTGVFLLLAVRTHYTADVLVGGFMAGLVFNGYHLAGGCSESEEMYVRRGVEWVESL